MKKLLFVLILALAAFSVQGQSLKRLGKLLVKKDYPTLEETLDKAYEKDSLNAAALYIHALLFLEDSYTNQNLDSAYVKIINAQYDLQLSDQKLVDKLTRSGLNQAKMDSLKESIEQQGFERAESENTVEAFQYFLDFFIGSTQSLEAIEKRNELAFSTARAENTYESYLYFLETYPEARQVNEARELYEIRLFQERTGDGSLASYQQFILDYPQSPFRNHAEKEIFDRMTLLNRASDYLGFLRDTDHKFYTRKAADFLYFADRENYDKWKVVFSESGEIRDSLEKVNGLNQRFLIPFLEVSRYGFMDSTGRTVIERSLDHIMSTVICEGLSTEYIQTRGRDHSAILGRNLEIIFEGDIRELNDLGSGLLEIIQEGGNQIIQMGGHKVLRGQWDEARLFRNSILGVRTEDHWRLYSLSGVLLTDEIFDEIQEFEKLLLVNRAGLWNVLLPEDFAEELPDPEFSKIEIEESFLIAGKNGSLVLLDSLGRKRLEKEFTQIERIYDKWLLENDSARFLVEGLEFEQATIGDDFQFNEKFSLVARDTIWALLNKDSLSFNLSEPLFLGTQFLIAHRNDSLLLFYHPDSASIFLGNAFPELITNSGQQLTDSPGEILLITDGKKKTLIRSDGTELKKMDNYEDFVINQEYIIFSRRGKKGILDFNGEQLLAPGYDAIGNYSNSRLALLKNKKFGAYRYFPSLMILPKYDIAIEEFTEEQFKARKDGSFGLLNAAGDILLDHEYDEILPWSDSLVLVKKDFRWKIVNVNNGKVLQEDIKDFKKLDRKDEILLKILTGTGYGIISNKRGLIVPPVYSDLGYFRDREDYIYFCEKSIEEASFYVLIYINDSGRIIRKSAFEEEDYRMIYCESD